MYLKRQDSLKEANEVANRELGNLEEKFRQSQLKINLSNKSIKDLNEEVSLKLKLKIPVGKKSAWDLKLPFHSLTFHRLELYHKVVFNYILNFTL